MNKTYQALIATGFSALLSVYIQAEDNDAGARIQALMTPQQYRAAGLDKLNAAESEALYQWLQTFRGVPAAVLQPTGDETTPAPASGASSATTTATATGAVTAAPPPASDNPEATALALEQNFGLPDPVDTAKAAYQLHAAIREPFRGWSGDTVFYLDNGQIWKQRTKGRHVYTGDDNRVVISQNLLGFYEMRLIAADRSVGVKRIK
jgi:hypothetical protein